MEIGHINSVITVFRECVHGIYRQSLSVAIIVCAVGVEYRYYQGLHSIPDPTFCAFVQ